jgi:hypothetical protein
MAYATKYSLTWKDYEGITWGAYFKEDGFGGSVTALTSSGTPAVMNWNSSDKYQPIVGSHVDFNILYEEANDLYVEGSRDLAVEITRATVPVWNGYVSPGQYLWRFNQAKTFVVITATDCLGELKNIKFEDGSGDPYYLLEEQAVIIANILLKTGQTFPIWEAINIFEDSHSSGAGYSPLDQTYVYQEKYWDERTDKRGNCYEVLAEILTNYGAQIRQYNSTWIITRANSFCMDTIYWRVFSAVGVYSSYTSSTSYIEIDSDHKYMYEDQEITKLAGISNCEVTLNPPRREQMFKNGTFDSWTWDGSNFEYWSESGSPTYTYDSGTLKMQSNDSLSAPTAYIEQTINIYYPSSIQIIFDWKPVYTGTPGYKNIYLQIYDGTYYLTTSGWQSGVGYYSITAPALSTGIQFTATIDVPEQLSWGYDNSFDLRFRIYEFWNENPPATNYVIIDNLRLTVDTGLSSTRVYSHENTASLNNLVEKEVGLGDSWLGNYFSGPTMDDLYWITALDTTPTMTELWSITGDPTSSTPLAEILARQTVEGYRRSVDLFRGTIRSNAFDMTNVAWRDSNRVDEYGFEKSYLPLEIAFDVRKNEWSGEWVECPPTYTDEEMEWDSHDAGLKGTITGNELEIDNWTHVGSGAFAYFDDYVSSVNGQFIRLVVNLVQNGSSSRPSLYLNSDLNNLSWGMNYITYYIASAGTNTIELRSLLTGRTYDFTCTIDVYSITGI